MDHEQIKEVIYNTLRSYYRPIGQNKLWKLVRDTFYLFVDPNPESRETRVLQKKLDETKKFSRSTFRKALGELVEDGRVFVYDDKKTRLGRKLYSANVNYNELRDIISSRLDRMLKTYQEKLDLILGSFKKLDNSERAKMLWKLHLLLFTAEYQIKLYNQIFRGKLDTESLLSNIKNMRNTLDDKSRSIGVSNYKELTQNLVNEVIDTAIKYYDSVDSELKK